MNDSSPELLATGKIRASEASKETGFQARALVWKLVAALGLIAIVSAIFSLGAGEEEQHAGRRSSYSPRADGFLGIFALLRALGLEPERQRLPYTQLPDARDSILVLVDPVSPAYLEAAGGLRLDAQQSNALREWVEDGGRIIAALPGVAVARHWALGDWRQENPWNREEKKKRAAGGDFFREWLGPVPGSSETVSVAGDFRLENRQEFDLWQALTPRESELLASYLDSTEPGRETLHVFAEPLPEGWVAAARLEGKPIAISRAMGRGEVWLFSSSYPFANLALARKGTAISLLRVLDAVGAGASRDVLFDEYCHGVWQRRGAFGWIFGGPWSFAFIALAALAALLAWRGGVRRGAPRPLRQLPRRSKEEFVVSLGEIARRAGRTRAAARWTLEYYKDRARASARPSKASTDQEGETALWRKRLDKTAAMSEEELVKFSRDLERWDSERRNRS